MITTIIKTKNSAETLCDALESIRGLGEVFVIDEHSTDETIEIAREYKAKIIYSLKEDYDSAFNQAINEAQNEWIFVLEDNEIVPKSVVETIKKFVEKKKNKFASISFNIKTFYLDSEVKAALKRETRLFKKGYSNKGKVYKLKESCILKYIEADISKQILKTLDNAKIDEKKSDLFKPIKTFLYVYLIKKAYLDCAQGLVYAYSEASRDFIIEVKKLEKSKKNDN